MFFKNLTIFRESADGRLSEPLALSGELNNLLAQQVFKPCPKSAAFSAGWAPPLGDDTETLSHTINGSTLLCFQKEEKVMPDASINKMVADKVKQIEQAESRTVRRKERLQIKEEVIQAILPTALTTIKRTHLYIDHANGWIAVDTASASKADEVIALLRITVEGLRARLPNTNVAPRVMMTHWLRGEGIDSGFEIGDEYDLQDADKEGGTVRCKRQDPFSEEAQNHLDAGKQVTKLSIGWNERITCILTEDLIIKRLRFGDVVQEGLEEYEDSASIMDAQFALMTAELSRFIPAMIEALGGEYQEAAA